MSPLATSVGCFPASILLRACCPSSRQSTRSRYCFSYSYTLFDRPVIALGTNTLKVCLPSHPAISSSASRALLLAWCLMKCDTLRLCRYLSSVRFLEDLHKHKDTLAVDEETKKNVKEAWETENDKNECIVDLEGPERDYGLGSKTGMLGCYWFSGVVFAGVLSATSRFVV